MENLRAYLWCVTVEIEVGLVLTLCYIGAALRGAVLVQQPTLNLPIKWQ